MERLPLPVIDPSGDSWHRDVSNFVGGLLNSHTSYSSVIRFSKDYQPTKNFSVELTRRDSCRAEERLCRTYVAEGSALQVIRTLVACPTWTHAQFLFYAAGLGTLVLEILSLLRSSHSLSTLDIQSSHLDGRFLPTLLCENPSLETLTLNLNPGVVCNVEDAERLALCFSRNSVLKSCTIAVDCALDFQTWKVVLKPFTTNSKLEANVALRELAVLETRKNSTWLVSVISGEAIANLVRCNTTLERLEFRLSYPDPALIALKPALAANHTLKALCCNCSLARLKELVRVFVPERSLVVGRGF